MALDFFSQNKVIVGYNQLVQIAVGSGPPQVIRASSCSLKFQQNVNVPELIVGKSDRTVFSKGTIVINGSLSFPLMDDIGKSIIKTSDDLHKGEGSYGQITITSTLFPNNIAIVAYVNSIDINITAGSPITMSVGVIGKPTANLSGNPDSYTSASGSYLGFYGGLPDGANPGNYSTKQVINFDRAFVSDGFLPGGRNYIIPKSLTIRINNNISPQYVLGVDEEGKLIPYAFSYKQRTISGTLTYISGPQGIGSIATAGLACTASGSLIKILGAGVCSPDNNVILDFQASDWYPLWEAGSPDLGTDIVTGSLNYQLIAKTSGIKTISSN